MDAIGADQGSLSRDGKLSTGSGCLMTAIRPLYGGGIKSAGVRNTREGDEQ